MRKISLLFLMTMVWTMDLAAQQDYYVFIQQPAGLPFYVRMGEDSYSSSAGGHLILSPMKDTTYEMYIGFPRSRYPEQLFRIDVDKNDRGFELKQFDGNWQLFDLQSKQLVRAIGRSVQKMEGVKRTDTYSELMAGVVNDTTVLYIDSMAYRDTSVIAQVDSLVVSPQNADDSAGKVVATAGKGKGKKEKSTREKKAKTEDTVTVNTPNPQLAAVAGSPAKDSTEVKVIAAADSGVIKERAQAVDTTTGANQPVRDPRDIIRLRTENVVEGKLMIFLDRTGAVTDTIRIIVPGR